MKRKKALRFVEELREFAHVVDVTQLYYTPDLYRHRDGPRHGNPAIDETYLLYCTQMLGVIGNLAPLYTRGATGDSILRQPLKSRCSPWGSPQSTSQRLRPAQDERRTQKVRH